MYLGKGKGFAQDFCLSQPSSGRNSGSFEEDMAKLDIQLKFIQEEVVRKNIELWEMQQENNYKEENGLSKAHMSLIKKLKMGSSHKQCSVCVENFSQGVIIFQLPCGHIFHKDCVQPWLKNKQQCPNCRLDLEQHFNSLSKFSHSNSSSDTDQINSMSD